MIYILYDIIIILACFCYMATLSCYARLAMVGHTDGSVHTLLLWQYFSVLYSVVVKTTIFSCGIHVVSLTRFTIQAKGPDGKWTRKPLAYRESNNVHLLITCPPETLFLNIFTLLAVTQSVDSLFHSFIVLCENECFLMSNLH